MSQKKCSDKGFLLFCLFYKVYLHFQIMLTWMAAPKVSKLNITVTWDNQVDWCALLYSALQNIKKFKSKKYICCGIIL